MNMEKAVKLEEKAGLPLCCSRTSCSSLGGSSGCGGGGETGAELKGADPCLPPNNNLFHLNQQQLSEIKFPKRRPVTIDFSDVKFSVAQFNFSKLKMTRREILHGVSGNFRSGELTAIMGPSGAGKSTLLNILAGLTSLGVSGSVRVNGSTARLQQRASRYIQQEDDLRAQLTAGEAMAVAAHLKLGSTPTREQKHHQVLETLAMLGLSECYGTLTGRLSGGQRKRLAIALELLSNPPVLYLDEPTTGLDSSSCSQCISLLKRLSQEGRTIICTIHQPSALLFDMFDKLYTLSDGYCIYNGLARELLPFLQYNGLSCPPFHNPADFLIEVAIGEHDVDLCKLAEIASSSSEEDVKNIISRYSSVSTKDEMELSDMNSKSSNNGSMTKQVSSISSNSVDSELIIEEIYPPASLLFQTWLLLHRNFLCARRDYSLMLWRLIAHIFIGLLFGYLYRDVGNNADTVLANYVYLYGTLLLVVYTGKMSVTLSFPLEMEILKREHFNRWYNLGPYLISALALEIPFQIICCASYISISYVMTGNLLVDFRMYYFFLISISTSLCAQSWGYFIGATTPVKIAVFLGPVVAVLFSVFGFCIRLADTPSFFQWMFHASYFRAGFHSLVYSVYGISRGKLTCGGEDFKYCHYRKPQKFLSEMDIMDIDIWGNLGLILGLGIFMHLITAGALWCRLNRR